MTQPVPNPDITTVDGSASKVLNIGNLTPADGDFLIWNATSDAWENKTVAEIKTILGIS